MKKQFLLFIAATLLSISSLMAQDATRQMQTPEEKTKTAMEKMAVLNLNADIKAKTEVIFMDFYKAQQKSMQEMRAAGNNDRDAMKEKHRQLVSERYARLKMIFTQDQLKKWINEIEPSLKPQRAANPVPAASPAPVQAPAAN